MKQERRDMLLKRRKRAGYARELAEAQANLAALIELREHWEKCAASLLAQQHDASTSTLGAVPQNLELAILGYQHVAKRSSILMEFYS